MADHLCDTSILWVNLCCALCNIMFGGSDQDKQLRLLGWPSLNIKFSLNFNSRQTALFQRKKYLSADVIMVLKNSYKGL